MLDGLDAAVIAIHAAGHDLQRARADERAENVVVEGLRAVGDGLIDQVNQQRALDDHDVQREVVVVGGVGVDLHVAHHIVLVHVDERVLAVLGAGEFDVGGGDLFVHHGDVRAGVDVLADHRLEGGVHDVIAVGQNGVLLLGAAQIVEVRAQRLHHAGVLAAVFPGQEGRQDEQAVVAGVQIPLLAGAEMIHQRVIVLLGDDAHVAHAGIDQIGQREVDDAIAARHGDGRHGALTGQLAQRQVVLGGVDNAHYIIHDNQPPSVR